MKKLIAERDRIRNGMSYDQYIQTIRKLYDEGKVTGDEQKESYLGFTRLNLQRMRRWDKQFEPSDEMVQAMKSIADPQIWVVITEGWCGDSAQSLPAIERIAALNPRITTRYFFRDENDDLMQQFLENGKRSIPQVVAIDNDQHVLWQWGSRPAGAVEILMLSLAEGNPPAIGKERMHLWYTENAQSDLQKELIENIRRS